jgi:hypothetical protein
MTNKLIICPFVNGVCIKENCMLWVIARDNFGYCKILDFLFKVSVEESNKLYLELMR